jgi:hypothetical protein
MYFFINIFFLDSLALTSKSFPRPPALEHLNQPSARADLTVA